ncbi:MAG: ATP-binding cassette domain-containing protein, partial [Clostridia bacterium]|nr:ATP-binding cassette domain-containing protein [Clostridia bacterium]
VEEIVRSGCIGRKDAAKRLAERVRRLNLTDMLKKPYRTLSGGQQQRVLLARALCATDSLIILDEPSAALDPDATADLYRLVDSLHRDDGVAVVMVSHDPVNTLAFADKVLVMRRNAAFYGTPEDYKAFQGA